MDEDTEIRELVKAIRHTLPTEAAKADQIMLGRGFESDEERASCSYRRIEQASRFMSYGAFPRIGTNLLS